MAETVEGSNTVHIANVFVGSWEANAPPQNPI
jgi:hypothetical protein